MLQLACNMNEIKKKIILANFYSIAYFRQRLDALLNPAR